MRVLRDQRYIDMLKFGQQKESHRVTLPVQSENIHLNREIIIPKHRLEGKLYLLNVGGMRIGL